MRTLFIFSQKWQPVAAEFKNMNISWSNLCEILKLKDIEEIRYYLNLSNKLCLTKHELREKIKSKEYERLDK